MFGDELVLKRELGRFGSVRQLLHVRGGCQARQGCRRCGGLVDFYSAKFLHRVLTH